MVDFPEVIVAGARSMVGRHLLSMLARQDRKGICLTRNPASAPELPQGFTWKTLEDLPADAPEKAIILSLLPIHAIGPVLEGAGDISRIVATSSAMVSYEEAGSEVEDSALVGRLKSGEEALISFATSRGIPWTILRPTMIYDPGQDRNVSAMAAFAKRSGFIPLAGPALGKTQPIHAEDVARAMVSAMNTEADGAQVLDLPGGETIAYRDLARRIFEGMGRAPRIVAIPGFVVSALLWVTRVVFRRSIRSRAFERMNIDRIVDGRNTNELLGLSPRPFHPDFRDR